MDFCLDLNFISLSTGQDIVVVVAFFVNKEAKSIEVADINKGFNDAKK